MKFRKFKSSLFCVCILLSLIACQFTTTNFKNPTFSRDEKSLSKDINDVISTQAINVSGEGITTNGKTKSVLTIELINPKNIPSDTADRSTMLMRVASIIKYALKDTSEFMYYNVYFVNRTTKDHVTNTSSMGDSFNSEEIKPE